LNDILASHDFAMIHDTAVNAHDFLRLVSGE
jgi:hypothetical protein